VVDGISKPNGCIKKAAPDLKWGSFFILIISNQHLNTIASLENGNNIIC
jgi:hypothetical protein